LLDRKPFALSGGQRQRVAVGRAIVRDPKVFLFDEPLSNLDAALRVSTRNELIKLHHRLGATMIYVTHDQVEAMTMGSRICIMNGGRVVQVGAPLEVYRRPADTFVARFLGNPPMNLLPATMAIRDGAPAVRIGGVTVPLTAHADARLPAIDAPVTFGIRPEDLYEQPPASPTGLLVDITGQTLAVEPLGAETLLVVAPDGTGQEVIARIGRDTAVRAGQPITLRLDAGAAHLFDPGSGAAITRR
jgi:multiple sugar transport system ATP-binding protein